MRTSSHSLFQNKYPSARKSKQRFVVFDDASPSDPHRKSFKVNNHAIMMSMVANACVRSREETFNLAQVFFDNSDKAEQELREFNENASLGDDAPEFCKAFIAENYVQTEEEVAKTALESWVQFKEKAKLIIGVRVPPSHMTKLTAFPL
jgi:hypothetical protein